MTQFVLYRGNGIVLQTHQRTHQRNNHQRTNPPAQHNIHMATFEPMDRTSSSSCSSDSDSEPIAFSTSSAVDPRKRRSPSAESAAGSELSDVSEPRDLDLDDFLDDYASHPAEHNSPALLEQLSDLPASDGGTWRTDELGGTTLESMVDADFDLPVMDDEALTALPLYSGLTDEQPASGARADTSVLGAVVALPVGADGCCSDSSSESSSTADSNDKLADKKRRNKEAAVRFRKNKKRRENEAKAQLDQLRSQVQSLEADKKKMQTQLEQFQSLFSRHNMQQLSSTLLSGLCVICAVICVVAPQDFSGRTAGGYSHDQRGSGFGASPTGRSLLSFTPPVAAAAAAHDVTEGFAASTTTEGLTATDLLLGCLSTASSRVFQEAM